MRGSGDDIVAALPNLINKSGPFYTKFQAAIMEERSKLGDAFAIPSRAAFKAAPIVACEAFREQTFSTLPRQRLSAWLQGKQKDPILDARPDLCVMRGRIQEQAIPTSHIPDIVSQLLEDDTLLLNTWHRKAHMMHLLVIACALECCMLSEYREDTQAMQEMWSEVFQRYTVLLVQLLTPSACALTALNATDGVATQFAVKVLPVLPLQLDVQWSSAVSRLVPCLQTFYLQHYFFACVHDLLESNGLILVLAGRSAEAKRLVIPEAGAGSGEAHPNQTEQSLSLVSYITEVQAAQRHVSAALMKQSGIVPKKSKRVYTARRKLPEKHEEKDMDMEGGAKRKRTVDISFPSFRNSGLSEMLKADGILFSKAQARQTKWVMTEVYMDWLNDTVLGGAGSNGYTTFALALANVMIRKPGLVQEQCDLGGTGGLVPLLDKLGYNCTLGEPLKVCMDRMQLAGRVVALLRQELEKKNPAMFLREVTAFIKDVKRGTLPAWAREFDRAVREISQYKQILTQISRQQHPSAAVAVAHVMTQGLELQGVIYDLELHQGMFCVDDLKHDISSRLLRPQLHDSLLPRLLHISSSLALLRLSQASCYHKHMPKADVSRFPVAFGMCNRLLLTSVLNGLSHGALYMLAAPDTGLAKQYAQAEFQADEPTDEAFTNAYDARVKQLAEETGEEIEENLKEMQVLEQKLGTRSAQ